MAKKKKHPDYPRSKEINGVTFVEDEEVVLLEHWLKDKRMIDAYDNGFEGYVGHYTFEDDSAWTDQVAIHDVPGEDGGGWWCDTHDPSGRLLIVPRWKPVTDEEVREVFGLG